MTHPGTHKISGGGVEADIEQLAKLCIIWISYRRVRDLRDRKVSRCGVGASPASLLLGLVSIYFLLPRTVETILAG